MAVINSYQVGSQIGTPAGRTSSVRYSNAGAVALAQQEANTGKIAAGFIGKIEEKIRTADVMAASNEYRQRMNDLETELMQNKEQNALDNLNKLEEGRNKILEDIRKNGPSSLKWGAADNAFTAMVEQDWVGQRKRMQNYQLQQLDAYQTTQMNQQIMDSQKDVAAQYGSDAALAEANRRNDTVIAARYYNYGDARIKLEQDKARATTVNTCVLAALGADDYDRAGELLQGYGYSMSPETRIKLDKLITERKKSNTRLMTFENIYNQTGGDYAKALEILRSQNGTVDINAGMDFVRGSIGQQLGVNQCANFASKYIQAAGGDSRLESSLADGSWLNAKNAGLAFTDESQLKDGDLVYYSVAGSGYKASSDSNAVNSSTEALDGVTHVGIYDAKTGKVIQSGTHGVSAMDLHTPGYTPVGFAHIGSRKKSPTEQQAEEQSLMSFFNQKKKEQRMIDDSRFDNFTQQLMQWKQGGMSAQQAMQQAERMWGNDFDMLSKVRGAVDTVYYDFTSSGSGRGGKGFDIGIQASLRELLNRSKFKNKQDFSEYVLGEHPTASQYKSAMEMYDDWTKGTGSFAYDFAAIKEEVLAGCKLTGAEKAKAWNEAQAAAELFIKNYQLENHRQPTPYEVIDAAKKGMIKNYYGSYSTGGFFGREDVKVSTGEMARAGIRHIQPVGDDKYAVEFYEDRKPEEMSGAELNSFFGR